LTLDQPSYYHLHIHVQSCDAEAGEGLAAGKAWLLDEVIDMLKHDGQIFEKRTLHYALGEKTDLYRLLQS
jgi:m7GpppX diphosphatase